MADFEVQIKTPVELAGAQKLADELERNIGKAKALGNECGDLEAQLRKVNAAIEGAGEAAKKGSEGTGEFLEGHHGIHAIGHGLNEVLPGLMQFTRFLTSGFTAAIGVVVLAFGYLKDKIDEFSKTLDEISTGPGARGEWVEKIRDNTREAAVETALFNERLRELVQTQETLAKSTDDLIARQRQQSAAALELGNAQRELDLARVALAEKLHQITPDQAVLIRLQIDDAAFKRELDAKKAEIQAELSARQQEQRANEGREPGLRANVDRADAAALAAENARDKNTSKLAQDKSNLEATQAAYEKTQARIEELGHISLSKLLPFDRMEQKALEKQKEGQEAIIGGLQRTIGREQGKETPLATAAATAKEQASKAKADYEEAAKLAHETFETIEKLKSDLAAANARAGALQNIHRQTSAATSAGVNADIANRVAAGRGTEAENDQVADWQSQAHFAGLSGGELSTVASDARSAMSDARSALQSGHGDRRQLHDLLNEFLGLAQDIHASAIQRGEFRELAREVDAMRTRMNHNQQGP